MGNRLPHGLEGRGHWMNMLGVDERKVNVQWGLWSAREKVVHPARPRVALRWLVR